MADGMVFTWINYSRGYKMVVFWFYYSMLTAILLPWGFPGGTVVKESTCQNRRHKRRRFKPWVGKIPWSRKWQPTPVFLPGKFHGQRSLAGHSPHSHRVGCDWAQQHSTFFFTKGILPSNFHLFFLKKYLYRS